MAHHVRAMGPSVLYWDLVPVPMPTPTLYDYDTMAGFVYKVLEGVDMTTKLCFSSNVMLSGLVRRQEEIRLLYLLPLSELSKQRERSTLFSLPGSVRLGISFNSDDVFQLEVSFINTKSIAR